MASEKPFVHLHVHSSYSLQDSTVKVKGGVKRAKKLGMPGLALTDHGAMHGAVNFFNACKAAEIKPIIGCEFYACADRHKKSSRDRTMHHLLLLAKDEQGCHNLARLSSMGMLEGFYYKPRVDMELLEEYSEGLIATSCCERGQIPQAILNGYLDEAEATAGRFQEIYGKGNFYLELEDHGKESEKTICKELISMSKRLDIPLVATNDVHYLDRLRLEALFEC